jgi:pimeloyl-ACP methyl ester carboxylesterase
VALRSKRLYDAFMTNEAGRARADDGAEIAWESRGNGDPLLLVMGLGGRAADWNDRFVDALATSRRVVLFDNRGTGSSSKPLPPYTMAQMTDDAARVLDAAKIERAHVFGFSMGGMIAQRLALDHASRVDALVLMSTHMGGRGVVPPSREVMAIFQAPATGRAAAEIVRERVRAITAPSFADTHADALQSLVDIAIAQPTPLHAIAAQMQAVIEDDRSARIASIAARTLVVHGDRDRLIPIENGRAIASTIPHARLHVLEGCGHLPQWEMTNALLDVVTTFLPSFA